MEKASTCCSGGRNAYDSTPLLQLCYNYDGQVRSFDLLGCFLRENGRGPHTRGPTATRHCALAARRDPCRSSKAFAGKRDIFSKADCAASISSPKSCISCNYSQSLPSSLPCRLLRGIGYNTRLFVSHSPRVSPKGQPLSRTGVTSDIHHSPPSVSCSKGAKRSIWRG